MASGHADAVDPAAVVEVVRARPVHHVDRGVRREPLASRYRAVPVLVPGGDRVAETVYGGALSRIQHFMRAIAVIVTLR